MPKNFDEVMEQDREFVLGGQTFHWRPVHWRVFANWVDKSVSEAAAAAAEKKAAENGGAESESDEDDEDDITLELSLEKVLERITLYLIPSDKERFIALVNDPDSEIAILHLNELAAWLTEVQTSRPTTSPSPSATGPGRTAPISAVA